jgi:thiol-disulfide isomerase/thioredoxin
MKNIFIWISLFISISACKSKQEKEAADVQPSVTNTEKIRILPQNGQSIDMSQYKGKYVFINYWATWCKPCVNEMPSLQRLTEKLKEENIVFLFASDETTEEIAMFKRSNNYNMEFVKIEDLASLGISAIPTSFVYNKNGEVIFAETGSREWDSDESIAMITKAIKQ